MRNFNWSNCNLFTMSCMFMFSHQEDHGLGGVYTRGWEMRLGLEAGTGGWDCPWGDFC